MGQTWPKILITFLERFDHIPYPKFLKTPIIIHYLPLCLNNKESKCILYKKCPPPPQKKKKKKKLG